MGSRQRGEPPTGPVVRVPPHRINGPDRWGPAGTMGMVRGCALPGDRISSSSSSCRVVLRCVVLFCAVLCCAEGAVTKRQKAGMSTHG